MQVLSQRSTFCLSILILFLTWPVEKVHSSGICIYVSKHRLNWFEALFACQKKGMCLADIDTTLTLLSLTDKFHGDDRTDVWFGLTAFERTNYRYISSNKHVEFTPQNSQLVNNGSCAFLKPEDPTYTFASAVCYDKKRFACTKTEMCNGAHMRKRKNFCAIPHSAKEIMAY
ncbi:uncharacterized protein [Drosophila bipectinata]|uniref:uncharacterized protein n=1 Tax=Drosophila bipectinata TaxID=42026 RepID=UPI0038B3520A